MRIDGRRASTFSIPIIRYMLDKGISMKGVKLDEGQIRELTKTCKLKISKLREKVYGSEIE